MHPQLPGSLRHIGVVERQSLALHLLVIFVTFASDHHHIGIFSVCNGVGNGLCAIDT
jgi:hypothetical protein